MEPFHQLLLHCFREAAAHPARLPALPLDAFPAGSTERQLLEGLAAALAAQQQERRKAAERYEELVHDVEGIVWEADPDTFQFTFVSQRAERLLGYPLARWLAEPHFWEQHIHPEDRAAALARSRAAQAERRPFESEYRMLAADGRAVWVRDIVSMHGPPERIEYIWDLPSPRAR